MNRLFLSKRLIAVCMMLTLVLGVGFVSNGSVSFAKINKFALDKKSLTINVGETGKVVLKNVKKGKIVKKAKWSSSDVFVATVDNKGVVSAKSEGTAVVSVKKKNTKLSCKLIVKDAPRDSDIIFLSSKDSRIRTHFTDRFFYEDPTVYNNEMAKCTLALNLLCLPTIIPGAESANGEKSKLEKLIDSFGFTHFSVNDDYKDKPKTDSIGVSCAYKTIKVNKKKKTVVGVFVRGHHYDSEWASNMHMGDGSTILNHEGFELSRRKVSEFLLKYLKDNGITGEITFWLGAQSRGAAVSNLTAAWLTSKEAEDAGIQTSAEHIYCYCFAPPQPAYVGTGADKKDIHTGYEYIHNLTYDRDIVSRIPPDSFGFDKYGTTMPGPKGTDDADIRRVIEEIDTTASSVYSMAALAKMDGMPADQYVDSYVKKFEELVVDRVTYTKEWEATAVYAFTMLFGDGAVGTPDVDKLVKLTSLFSSAGLTLVVDHYPEIEYAYLATANL